MGFTFCSATPVSTGLGGLRFLDETKRSQCDINVIERGGLR
jgi:hypothetical protein